MFEFLKGMGIPSARVLAFIFACCVGDRVFHPTKLATIDNRVVGNCPKGIPDKKAEDANALMAPSSTANFFQQKKNESGYKLLPTGTHTPSVEAGTKLSKVGGVLLNEPVLDNFVPASTAPKRLTLAVAPMGDSSSWVPIFFAAIEPL